MNSHTHILYLSHIHWNWIKQRPQYLAEELSRYYGVSCFYGKAYKDIGLKENKANGVELRELPRMPSLGNKFRSLVACNDYMARRIIAKEVESHPDSLIWLTGPRLLAWVPKDYCGPIVYDCMDDHAAFYSGIKAAEIQSAERKVVRRANLVLVSSEKLAQKVACICGGDTSKIVLVRNGFNDAVLEGDEFMRAGDSFNKGLRACYFGTVSSWLDFDCIKASLDRFDSLSYKIIGPISGDVNVLDHPRIEYTGPVAHDSLANYIADCDCFVMPFKLNDIVLSVDPVKMYEYVNFGKDIVCVRYPEVERFESFAELYNGPEGYCDAIRTVMERPSRKYDEVQRRGLLAESGWRSRIKPVIEALTDL